MCTKFQGGYFLDVGRLEDRRRRSEKVTVLLEKFIHQWHYSPLLVPDLFLSFVIFFRQTVGLLVPMISPSQGRYLHTEQHKHRINTHTDIHALSWIRTHDSSVRASEDRSCLRPRGHCNRQGNKLRRLILADKTYVGYGPLWKYVCCS
jgi:hypothetical protein